MLASGNLGSTRPLVIVILALAGALAQPFRQWRAGGLQFGVIGERFRAVPQLQQGEFVGVEDALENLEFLAARVLPGLLAAPLEGLRELGALARRGGDRDDEAYCHVFLPDAGWGVSLVAKRLAQRRQTATIMAGRSADRGRPRRVLARKGSP